MLEKILEKPIHTPKHPQLLGALGAAISGLDATS
jgi:activator of 2-hydroxyglutaryl-CoA dehydratase